MRDEIDGRLWDEHHEAFSNWVHSLFEGIALVFCKLQKIQFQAPWNRQGGTAC